MTDLTAGCTRTGPHPARDITEMEARAEGRTPAPWFQRTGNARWIGTDQHGACAAIAVFQSKHDAAFAALACNSFEAMKAALEGMLHLHGTPKREEWLSDAAFGDALRTHERARAALSLSRGGTDKKEGA